MLTRRSWLVYGALFAIWLTVIGWQVVEHVRVLHLDREARIRDAVSWSGNLGLVTRSQQRGVALITEYVENSLSNQVKDGAFVSVLMLNATNGKVAAAGPPIDPALRDKLLDQDASVREPYWDNQAQTVTILNPVDLGTNIVVVPLSEFFAGFTNRQPLGMGTNEPAPTDSPGTPASPVPPATAMSDSGTPAPTAMESGAGAMSTNLGGTNFAGGRRRGGFRPRTITLEERQNNGVHDFIVTMSTREMLAADNRDLWLRVIIGMLTTISVAGYGLAWGNLSKTSVLQIRLVRQSELNSHLKEMNLAAAGLAHETRNPLNIIRGLAQMISRRDDASSEVRSRSREIIDETDRITAQLNEFINYSRPREVRRVAVNVNALAADVVRALNYDLEEKKVQIRVLAEPLTIQADEQLLRQALFNLVINAIQAVSAHGEIWIRAGRGGGAAFIEVADNGPGVSPEHRAELFKPYFTTHEEGTGLGLAVVQQIVLAHGWEITCLPNQPSGAIFRINHIRASGKVLSNAP